MLEFQNPFLQLFCSPNNSTEQAWGSKTSFTLLDWEHDKWVINHDVDFVTTPIGETLILEMGICLKGRNILLLVCKM